MARQADYIARIGRALAKIERGAGTGDWPGLAQLAEAAAMSEFHFHRIYRLMTGETPQQTLSRARIGGSLPALAGPGGIMGATDASAYATSQAYSRAVKSLTGATPTQLKADPALFEAVAQAVMKPAREQYGAELSIEIGELAPLRLYAVTRTGDYADLNHGYYHLFDLVTAQVPAEQVTGLYGIPYDDPRSVDADSCRFDCAVSTQQALEPAGDLFAIDRAAGPSLRLRIPGDYDRVHVALDHLYRIAIALDLELADARPLNFYYHDPEQTPEEDLVADIHLMLAE